MTQAVESPFPPARVSAAHLPELDGVRGWALFMVMFIHFNHTMQFNPAHPQVDYVYKAFLSAGTMAIDLFFVLSGYLITGILVDAVDAPRYFKNFYARRVLRIFPLYYGFLALTFILLPLFGVDVAQLPEGHQKWYWLYMPNFSTAWMGRYPAYHLSALWSLGVEEQFYMVWPFLVWLIPRKWLGLFLCLPLLGAPFFRFLMFLDTDAARHSIYVLPHTRMDALSYGALLAVLSRGRGGLAKLRPWAMGLFALSGAWCLSIYALVERFNPQLWDRLHCTLNYSMFGLFFFSVMALTLSAPPGRGVFRRFFTLRPLLILGKYSYAIYIFHFPLFSVAQKCGLTPEQLKPILGFNCLPAALFSVTMILLLTGLGWLSWNLYEKYFIDLKRYFYD